jgi:histidinol-phosphate aminotransferase
MAVNYIDLARLPVRGMQPYQPGKPVEEAQRELGLEKLVKLASNENPRGPSSKVIDAVNGMLGSTNRYPDANGFYLKQALAERHNVAAECITLGCGSNDVLELVASAYLDSSNSAIYDQHAFIVYSLAVARSGAKALVSPANAYGHNLEAMLELLRDDTRVIYIANPNNPTGTYVGESELRHFLQQLPADVIVVLDEAYVEYVDQADYPNGLLLAREFPNLLLTRTFSKAYGLSGFRVGYGISNPDIADVLNRVRQPFNVASPSLVAALTSLDDSAYIDQTVATNRAGMQQLEAGFSQLGLDYIPSVGNFITFKCIADAGEMNQKLLQQGVIVRPIANYAMPEHLRVSIGLEEENSFFLQQLEKVLNNAR